jgi:hypothetical protein
MPKKKTDAWFVKTRGSYLPCSWQGWLTYIPFIAYLITSALVVRRQFSSIVSDIYYILPQWVVAAVILTWVAQRKSK